MIDVEVGSLIIEGKTKKVYEHPKNPDLVIVKFKSDITAGDGEKHKIMPGKNKIDFITNANIFRLLNENGIPTHYLRALSGDMFLAKKLNKKLPLEVITRRVAYGSILERMTDLLAGHHFKDLWTEFSYKDDFLHDPFIDERFVQVKDLDGYFKTMKDLNERIFIVLENAFRKLGYQLIDFKLEYGIIEDGILIVIDEITAGSLRLWPIKVDELDLSQDNLLDQLDMEGMKDKQLFRQGKDLAIVKEGFEVIADLTKQF